MLRHALLALLVGASLPAWATQEPEPYPVKPFRQTPDIRELERAKTLLPAETQAYVAGPIVPAGTQPTGALSGRVVFTSGGHGWDWSGSAWALGRPVLYEMNEDYGNVDQMSLFAYYCFNAGATVVAFRPIGNQTNEVVLDNDSPGVTWSGAWVNSESAVFFGTAGDVPFRTAIVGATETATATYTPTIPQAGFYPVYCWALSGSDRTNQLYRINHTGGQSQVRVPHHMVGNGWIYLGTYYFSAGASAANGSVVISNLGEGAGGTSVVIADAIRFGNGMGDVDRGGGISTYPREDEASRYWVQRSLGVGQDTGIYLNGNVGAPPRMAAEMTRETFGNLYRRVYVGFHSNAGGGRGVTGLYNNENLFPGTATPNQYRLAELLGTEVNSDLVGIPVPPLELAWYNRGTGITYARGDYAFGEINNEIVNDEFDATIVEVAFHDSDADARLLRDSKARNWVARACYQGVVRYANEFDGGSLVFFPEPPQNVRAVATNSEIQISWSAPVAQGGSGAATSYVVYRSTNGYGFGNPVRVVGATSVVISNLSVSTDHYFRVAAVNAGGESFPSETVGCRVQGSGGQRALIVNAFDRFDRTTNLRQDVPAEGYSPPDGNGAIERVWPQRVNAFDYIVPHGKAISACGMAFDSCQNEAITGNLVQMSNYFIVVWACGNETTGDETFSAAEQTKVSAFLASGGRLFASGANIAYDLDRASGPTTADRNFLHEQLHVAFTSDSSGIYTAVSTAGGIFAGRSSSTIDDGSGGIYWVQSPDVVGPYGPGTAAALDYSSGTSTAAMQYDGSAGGGRVVFFGFPYETILNSTRRTQYMSDILTFLMLPLATNTPAAIISHPASITAYQGSNATFTVSATGTQPLTYQWRFNGADLPGATTSALTRSPALPVHSGNYQAVVSNAFGIATSQVATLIVYLYPDVLFSDNFDASTSGNWTLNRSSADTRVTFNWNYAPLGIPSAPGSGGTTRGLRCEANMVNGVAAALSLSPVGQSFSGDYRLRLNLWMNANGSFPLGGTGSTQHGTAGVGTAGTSVLWVGPGSTADGTWFAVDGEGQATDTGAIGDFCAFSGPTILGVATGVYAAGTVSNARGNLNSYYASTFPGGQTAPDVQLQSGALEVGTIGFVWRDVTITKQGTTVQWAIDGLPIATVTGASLAGNNFAIGYYDYFTSLSDNTNLSFGLFDNVRVERLTSNAPPYITSQPLSQTAKAGSNATFSVIAGGVPAPGYQWRLNGAPIAGGTASSYTRLGVQTNDAGNYSVVVSNVAGRVASADALLAVSPPLPLKFDLISVLPDHRIRFVLGGEPGSYAIETTADFSEWSTLTNLSIGTGPMEFTDDSSTNAPQRFYRAKSGS